MRKIINIAVLALFGLAVLSSCSKEDDPMFGAVDYNAPGYSQFMNVQSDFVVNKLNASGDAENGEGTIEIQLLGPPSSTARTVNFTISDRGILKDDDGIVVMTPATSAMFTLSASAFTIPAGETSASITVALINLELPLEETVYFDIELTSGDVEIADVATSATVTLFKKEVCPYVNATQKSNLIGDWDVYEQSYYASRPSGAGTYHVSDGGDNIILFTESFWWNGPSRIWGETTTDVGDPVPVVIDDSDPVNPVAYIPEGQYLMTTEGIYPYWVADMNTAFASSDYSFVFDNCAQTLTMNIGIGYDGDVTYHIDAFQVVLDWSGTKKVAYVNRNPLPVFDYTIPFEK